MPELRRHEPARRAERDAIEAEIDDATNYLKLADTIESFTTRLTDGLDDMDTDQQARILQLLVRDVLIGGDDETVTVRHSIPLPTGGENPESPLHTVRHGVPSFPAFAAVGLCRTGKVRRLPLHTYPQLLGIARASCHRRPRRGTTPLYR